MDLDYTDLFTSLKNHLVSTAPVTTKKTTRAIKGFFFCKFQDYEVLSSETSGEFMFDILVSNFRPLEVIDSDNRGNLSLVQNLYEPLLVVESELGGRGASSAYPVMKNVIEDFMKIVFFKCNYKIMVFTSLPFNEEDDHILNRVNLLKELYEKSISDDVPILLIHIKGESPRTQVQTVISNENITGFIINKTSVERIA